MSTSKKKKKGERFSKNDLEYLVFSLNEHMELLDHQHSCPWENTLAEHKTHAKAVIQKAPLLKGKGAKPKEVISEEDYFFIEFVIQERSDFLYEGQGVSWKQYSPHNDATFGSKLLSKLRRVLGLQQENSIVAVE